MNHSTFAGRIGSDAVTRQTKSGDSVTSFSVAVDQRKGGEKSTLWVDCSMWRERGEKLAPYLTKGTSVVVGGAIAPDVYDGKPKLRLDVQEITLLGGGKTEGGSAPVREKARKAAPASAGDIDDFDLPF